MSPSPTERSKLSQELLDTDRKVQLEKLLHSSKAQLRYVDEDDETGRSALNTAHNSTGYKPMHINKVNPLTARSMSKPIQFIKEVDFSRDLSHNASRDGRDADVSISELVKGFKTPSKATIAIRDDENPSGKSPSHRRQNYSMIITQFQDDSDLFTKKQRDRDRT